MRQFPRVLALTLSCLLFASPALANEAIETQPIAQGQLVYPADIAQWPETSRNETGLAITSLLGVQNLLPAVNPLAISLSGSAMTFTIGGGSQTIIAQDSTSGGSGNTRLIDSCPAQTITIPANSTGSTRNDLLSIEYNQLATNPHSVPFSNSTSQTVSNALESCLYNYTTATSSPPTNYVAFARVAVPNGATLASQATVTYLFPTVSSQLATVLGGVTSSVNGQQGAVTLAQGNGILVTTGGGTITTTLSTPVSTANGGNGTGSPSLTPGTNLSSSGSWAGQTLSVVNSPAFAGSVAAGSGTAPSVSSGDLAASRSTTTGVVKIGGSSSACVLDYGVTLGSWDTFGCPVESAGAITAGSATAPSGPTAGFLQTSSSTTAGAVIFGGSSSSAGLDYGVNHSGAFTFGAPLFSGVISGTGAITAGWLTAPSGPATGDLQASRSTTTGAIQLGGSSSSAGLDYGVNHSGAFTFGAPLFGLSETLSGTATAQYLNMSGNGNGYATAGFPLGVASNAPKWVTGTGTASTGGTANSYPNSFSFSSAGECFSGPAGGFGQVGATWGASSVTLYTNNASPTSVQYFCVGI